ncbi:MAG: alpha-isopropylmalate synthase regulatory domain-containing protein [Clostridia bacterium]|nr:alpha-isopropylmalate synthase regulatory domain-containing protein [Clostridia bacterium]
MRTIALSDITLKTSNGLALSFKEKIELAKLLDRLNVFGIELSPIQNRKIDSLLVKSVAMAAKNAVVAVPVNQNVESVDIAWAAVKEAKSPRLQVQAPMSPTQMEYFWHKKPDKMLEAISALVGACREKCADVEFIADDACRSEHEFLYQAIRAAIAAGASTVTLCDAAGLMFPEEFSAFISSVKANVPELANVRLGVLCSNALSMAGACAIAAIRAGADEIKTVSCASDVTALGDIAAILKNRGDSFDLGCGVRHAEIRRITAQIEWLCSARGQKSPYDGGVSAVADAAGMVLSVHDDLSAVSKAVEKLGYTLSDEDNAKVYEAFQAIAAKKEHVSARELDTIVASVALQVPPTYQLDKYVINCGNAISASAHIRLIKDGGVLEGICLGDGPIDAAFLSIEQVIGHHYELDDFQIQSVTEGREAMGETVVRLRSGGRLYSGRGISTDIVGASILAYLSALNKIVYEEAEA